MNVKVKVNAGRVLRELGRKYVGGQTLETTVERSKQLGGIVTIVYSGKTAIDRKSKSQKTRD